MRRVVVLPQPEGPSRAKNDPAGIVSVRSSTATKSPKDLTRLTRCRSCTLSVAATRTPLERVGSLRRQGYIPMAFWNSRWYATSCSGVSVMKT